MYIVVFERLSGELSFLYVVLPLLVNELLLVALVVVIPFPGFDGLFADTNTKVDVWRYGEAKRLSYSSQIQGLDIEDLLEGVGLISTYIGLESLFST